MIEIEKLQSANDTIHVQPSDRIFEELGNNTYDFKDLISELIDNSIAARRLDRILKITVELWVDQRNIAKKILVRDDGLGIPQDRLGLAISPAAIQTPNSLNEHGLGVPPFLVPLRMRDFLPSPLIV